MAVAASALTTPGSRRILHVGAGYAKLEDWLSDYDETRLDIDPNCRPDVVAPMTDMGDIGPFEIVFCSHALEHLYPHEVNIALREFLRVLAPGGTAIVQVPDLEDAKPSDEVLFVSPAGPITGLDLMYGHRIQLSERPYMAHHTGFTSATLEAALTDAGFVRASTKRLSHYNLLGTGAKP